MLIQVLGVYTTTLRIQLNKKKVNFLRHVHICFTALAGVFILQNNGHLMGYALKGIAQLLDTKPDFYYVGNKIVVNRFWFPAILSQKATVPFLNTLIVTLRELRSRDASTIFFILQSDRRRCKTSDHLEWLPKSNFFVSVDSDRERLENTVWSLVAI